MWWSPCPSNWPSLAVTGECMPGLEVFGNGLVEKGALGVEQKGVRWASDGRHGAVPAWAGCLMVLCLYPALCISLLAAGSLVTPELIAGCANSTRATGLFDSKTQRPKDYTASNATIVNNGHTI